jgi:hypothetical protein
MKTVSSLLDAHWYERYKKISKLNIRSSIYDVTNRCNLRCKGCFFFSSGEHKAAAEEKDIGRWHAFVDKREMARGVNLAILIGGEPTLCARSDGGLLPAAADLLRHQRPDQGGPGPLPGHDDRHLPVGRRRGRKILRGKDTFRISSATTPATPTPTICTRSPPGRSARPRSIIAQSAMSAEGPHAAAFQ